VPDLHQYRRHPRLARSDDIPQNDQAQLAALILGLAVSVYVAWKLARSIGGYICGLDQYQVQRWHIAILIVDFIIMAVVSLFAILLALYERLAHNLEKKIRENEKLQRLQVESKLSLLQSRINPHFLFNTLNTMLDIVRRDLPRVEKMILNLSDIYRRTLTMPDNAVVDLQDELKLVEEYLEIEKMRMGDRLRFAIDVKDNLERVKIPPMMLQILVENAIKHGLSPMKEGGAVNISVSRSEDKLLLEVTDTGVGIDEKRERCGFGLHSIQERLKLAYESAKMKIARLAEGGTRIRIVIPQTN
jgi:two-component system LytT family sensor kinase